MALDQNQGQESRVSVQTEIGGTQNEVSNTTNHPTGQEEQNTIDEQGSWANESCPISIDSTSTTGDNNPEIPFWGIMKCIASSTLHANHPDQSVIDDDEYHPKCEYTLDAIFSTFHFHPAAIVLFQVQRKIQGLGMSQSTKDVDVVRYIATRGDSYYDYAVLSGVLLAKTAANSIVARRAQQVLQPPTAQAAWSEITLPVEIFEFIAADLSHADLKAMRLVSRDFEQKASAILFETSAVSFSTELYDPDDVDHKSAWSWKLSDPAMNRPYANVQVDRDLCKARGREIFEGFGRYIRRFGLSFEVAEEQLTNVPCEQGLEESRSYFGAYQWSQTPSIRSSPPSELRTAAAGSSRMKAAFSKLTSVKELAIAIDTGLGWLNGPDKSAYAQICQPHTPMFTKDRSTLSRRGEDIWQALMEAKSDLRRQSIREHSLAFCTFTQPTDSLRGLNSPPYNDISLWPSMTETAQCRKWMIGHDLPSSGAICLTTDHPGSVHDACRNTFRPRQLTTRQLKWLLETGQAQRAFLETYMLAVVDNADIFRQVTALSLVKISSGLLSVVSESTAFWDVLQNLTDVTLKVSADWRTIGKDEAGHTASLQADPSEAVDHFFLLIARCVQNKSSIKRLHLGYTAGGEHADGLFARNTHILPVPLSRVDETFLPAPDMRLHFPHIEELTLSNCWILPIDLMLLARDHAKTPLTKLCLRSVSLLQVPPMLFANPRKLGVNHEWIERDRQEVRVTVPASDQSDQSRFWDVLQRRASRLGQHKDDATNPRSDMWRLSHPFDSWGVIIGEIIPWENFLHFYSDRHPPEPRTFAYDRASNLKCLELDSVGYHQLYDMDLPNIPPLIESSRWFSERRKLLEPVMMTTRCTFLGTIKQFIPAHELQALALAWNLHEGWSDNAASEAAWFDDQFRGGTGRVSGIIKESDWRQLGD